MTPEPLRSPPGSNLSRQLAVCIQKARELGQLLELFPPPPTPMIEPRHLTAHHSNTLNDALSITAHDPGSGGAPTRYEILNPITNELTTLKFQTGPIKDASDVNGISNEALLAIVIDRLTAFQHPYDCATKDYDLTAKAPFNCLENFRALHHVLSALSFLHNRTRERLTRGVEGTLNP